MPFFVASEVWRRSLATGTPHLPHYIVVLLFPLISLLLCSLFMITKTVKVASKRRCSQCIFRCSTVEKITFTSRLILFPDNRDLFWLDNDIFRHLPVRYPSVSICICHPSSAKEYELFTGTNPRYPSTYITVGWWWGTGNNEEAIGTEWDWKWDRKSGVVRLPRISRQCMNSPTTVVNVNRLPPLSSCLRVRAKL